ncbi:copper amine oxidase [Bacillus sp. HMF5848]|uniref:cell wall elongation regulator TseB-like domain-containing protein n=1 Tax=Bacillus sp. HMF5848 TaxID=2495421 RepID=UPI000F7A56E7|nr:DUF5590 domain-containing protein [Bacillus sp. HMF5848]RSK27399.1 copper amine oxidase [Bacillus sp. HMF5848]
MKFARYSSIVVVIALLIFAILGFDSLRTAISEKNERQQSAIKAAQHYSDIKQIEHVYTYSGVDSYDVVIGISEEDERIAVWVPRLHITKSNKLFIRKLEDGIDEQQAIDIVTNKLETKKIVSVTLGMENEVPLWEITYIDSDDSYCYYYVSFDGGEFLKRYCI